MMTTAEWLNQPMDLITPAEWAWSFAVSVFRACWAFVWRLLASGCVLYGILNFYRALHLVITFPRTKERDIELHWLLACAAWFVTIAWLFID